MATSVVLRSAPNLWASADTSSRHKQQKTSESQVGCCISITGNSSSSLTSCARRKHSLPCLSSSPRHKRRTFLPLVSLSSSSPSYSPNTSTKLYVSGLSFRTTEESLRNAFQNFGQLVEVNLVMDRIANRPRGFAFLRYATEEESQKAIEGMHGRYFYKHAQKQQYKSLELFSRLRYSLGLSGSKQMKQQHQSLVA